MSRLQRFGLLIVILLLGFLAAYLFARQSKPVVG